jgi:hypothetical protein
MASDCEGSLTKVFKRPHAKASRGDEAVRVADLVLTLITATERAFRPPPLSTSAA